MNTGRLRSNLAVFALTSGGAVLARRLAVMEGAHLYLPARFNNAGLDQDMQGNVNFFHDFKETVRSVFNNYAGFIFIMAAGIVVRTAAPLLSSKYSDPAIVVVDEAGYFAISLVSGHVGGANKLAGEVAGILGGTPVITTATDVRGKPAVDVLANQLNCVPVPSTMVKTINRALVEGESVALISRWPLPDDLTAGFDVGDSSPLARWKVVIDRSPGPEKSNVGYLLPRNLVIGVGCRRGVSEELVIEALENVLVNIPYGKKRLKALATVDVKKDEAGICNTARKYGLPLEIISRAEIKELAGTYEESEFVKKTLGVGGVCEPAAIIASNRGRVVIPKRKVGPVTVAVTEEKLWWWDWDPGTGSV